MQSACMACTASQVSQRKASSEIKYKRRQGGSSAGTLTPDLNCDRLIRVRNSRWMRDGKQRIPEFRNPAK